MMRLSIGKVAKKAGVNIDTVRYYERRRLLEEPTRSPSGYRQYLPNTVRRIKFIKRTQELGFSLDEIGELLLLKVDDESTYDEVKIRVETKISEIQAKIETLQNIQAAFIELMNNCDLLQPTESCPILNALARNKLGASQ